MAWERIADTVGCAPRHWKITTSKPLPVCSTQEQNKDINYFVKSLEEDTPPCRSMERITTTFMEEACTNSNKWLYSNVYNHTLTLRFILKEIFFKQIEIVKAYNFDSLIGNAGKHKNMACSTRVSMTVLSCKAIYICLFLRRLHWSVSWLHTCTIARPSVSTCGLDYKSCMFEAATK